MIWRSIEKSMKWRANHLTDASTSHRIDASTRSHCRCRSRNQMRQSTILDAEIVRQIINRQIIDFRAV
jgi:hypothetical protein